MSFHARLTHGDKLVWMPAACFETHSTTALCCTLNPRRIDALLEMAYEDLAGARALLATSTRLARYHVPRKPSKLCLSYAA